MSKAVKAVTLLIFLVITFTCLLSVEPAVFITENNGPHYGKTLGKFDNIISPKKRRWRPTDKVYGTTHFCCDIPAAESLPSGP